MIQAQLFILSAHRKPTPTARALQLHVRDCTMMHLAHDPRHRRRETTTAQIPNGTTLRREDTPGTPDTNEPLRSRRLPRPHQHPGPPATPVLPASRRHQPAQNDPPKSPPARPSLPKPIFPPARTRAHATTIRGVRSRWVRARALDPCSRPGSRSGRAIAATGTRRGHLPLRVRRAAPRRGGGE